MTGRGRGGLTRKIRAALDALGLPVRVQLAPGQWADTRQAERPISGFEGAGHIVADSGYETGDLRHFSANTFHAEAQIRRNRSRARCCPIDWAIDNERDVVERFINRIKRSRRIALRVEESRADLEAFVSVACATAWLA